LEWSVDTHFAIGLTPHTSRRVAAEEAKRTALAMLGKK
jgi:hypothetical protein